LEKKTLIFICKNILKIVDKYLKTDHLANLLSLQKEQKKSSANFNVL